MSTSVFPVTVATPVVCKPRVCDVGGGGNILPLFGDGEQRWNKSFRAILYMLGLLWFFMGVAIVSDIFMGAIERITAKKMKVHNAKTNKEAVVKVWNDTVANLTLMALGSSAPEILLSVIELCTNDFISGDLGPSTIVGSAAFNLLVITAVCVYAIPDGEIRKIKDVGVFAITASFSVFAYLWLYIIVQVTSPDEIDIFEGCLTFIFFPVLVGMAFIADKGYFTFVSGVFAEAAAVPRCARSHELEFLATTRDADGWGCDGRFQPGGCRSGITGYHQTRGVERYRCDKCDYDLCKKCVDQALAAGRRHETSHIIGSDVSKEELAHIELKMLQTHGDGLSDEQLARLIQKQHAGPMTRAVYRVAAIRDLVGGKKIAAVRSETQYSMSAIVPTDSSGGVGGELVKKPVLCLKNHTMFPTVTPKANYNCDVCQKRFPAQTVMYGCRTCNFDACSECKNEFIKADSTVQFCSAKYSVLESVGTLIVRVTRFGDLSQRVFVDYRTRDGSAKSFEDFLPLEGRLEFDVGEISKVLPVKIVDDTNFEEDEEFYIELDNPTCNQQGSKVVLGANKTCTISIVDDDLPGVLAFDKETVSVTEGIDNKVITVSVKRRDGSCGTIMCNYATEDGSAKAGSDYLSVSGTLTFEPGHQASSIQLTVLAGHHYESAQDFRLVLSECTGGGKLGPPEKELKVPASDPKADVGAETRVCTITIDSDEAARGRVDRVMKVLMLDWEKAHIGHTTWWDQFVAAVMVNGGEDDGDASIFDWIMHVMTIFWKVFFAFIPPVEFCDGWVCFVSSLMMIGLVTAFIGDMAGLLGCVLDIPDKITAITFVALGTSLPDTFASKTAAEQDPYADASIGNVTGSNSVNVFLGLGLPWVMGSIYWKAVGKNERWVEEYGVQYPEFAKINGDGGMFVVIGGDLGFSVGVFSGFAILSIASLCIRRRLFGGELGGPRGPKIATAIVLVAFWIGYVSLSSWMILKNRGECS